MRTPATMQEFLLLEQELTKLEGSGFNPTSAASILPPSVYDPSSSKAAAPSSRVGAKARNRVAELVRHLNPRVLPQAAFTSSSPHSSPLPAIEAAPSPSTSSRTFRDPAEPVEALWWDIVGPSTSSSLLFGAADAAPTHGRLGANGTLAAVDEVGSHTPRAILPPLTPALAAAMPHVPWLGYSATPYETAAAVPPKSPRKSKGKQPATANGSTARRKGNPPSSKPKAKREGALKTGIAAKMQRNCETLRRIRRIGDTLARESTTADLVSRL